MRASIKKYFKTDDIGTEITELIVSALLEELTDSNYHTSAKYIGQELRSGSNKHLNAFVEDLVYKIERHEGFIR